MCNIPGFQFFNPLAPNHQTQTLASSSYIFKTTWGIWTFGTCLDLTLAAASQHVPASTLDLPQTVGVLALLTFGISQCTDPDHIHWPGSCLLDKVLPSCQHLPIYGIIISVSALTLKAEPGRWDEAKPALPPRLPGLLGVAPFSSLRASPAPCPRHFVRNTVLLPQTPFPSIPSSNPSTALRIQALESDCLRLSPGFPHINYMALIKCDLTLKTRFSHV